MPRKLGFKPTLRDQRESVNKALDHYALLSGRPTPEGMKNVIAPRRAQAARRDLEGPVISAISELLAVHPRVIWAARFNSGMASYEAKSGRYAPVWFHKFLRMPEPMRMPDFFGLTGDTVMPTFLNPQPSGCLRFIAIEAKAPGWTKPRDAREREQAAFLAMIRSAGGIGIFATSAEQVAEALR